MLLLGMNGRQEELEHSMTTPSEVFSLGLTAADHPISASFRFLERIETTGIFLNCRGSEDNLNGGIGFAVTTVHNDSPQPVMKVEEEVVQDRINVVVHNGMVYWCYYLLFKITGYIRSIYKVR